MKMLTAAELLAETGTKWRDVPNALRAVIDSQPAKVQLFCGTKWHRRLVRGRFRGTPLDSILKELLALTPRVDVIESHLLSPRDAYVACENILTPVPRSIYFGSVAAFDAWVARQPACRMRRTPLGRSWDFKPLPFDGAGSGKLYPYVDLE